MFKRKRKGAIAALLGLACLGFAASGAVAQAEPIDAYREMLANKTYTIKYTNLTPETRRTSRTLAAMTNGKMNDPMTAMYQPTQSIVVCDGDNRYEESGYDALASCRLQRGEEMYTFSRVKAGNSITYVGTVDGKAKKGETSAYLHAAMYAEKVWGLNFGDNRMTRFLHALLPNDGKAEGLPSYSRVASGTLPDGLNYVDYKADNSSANFFEAIRYYFRGDRMVKIAAGQYCVNDKGEMDGVRCIIKIDEFSPTPDPSYLKLPDGLEDKTKRDDNGKMRKR